MMEQQVLAAIKEQLEDMYLAERKVAEYILSNPQTAKGKPSGIVFRADAGLWDMLEYN